MNKEQLAKEYAEENMIDKILILSQENKQIYKNKLEYEGSIGITKEGYKMELVEYKNYYNCKIKLYIDTDSFIIVNKSLSVFKSGAIKNPYHPTIFNIGYIGQGIYKPSINNKDTKAYSVWNSILKRCYSKKSENPTYKDVTVCEEWLCFQNFAKWFYENYDASIMEGWQVDKDIICPECRLYSPETCALVPISINNLIKGKGILGVRKKNNKYLSYLSVKNK